MTLLVQSVALAVGGLLLFATLRTPREGRTALAFWLAVAAATVVAVFGGLRAREAWRDHDRVRDRDAGSTTDSRRRHCLTDTGADHGFYGWASGRIPEGERYFLTMRDDVVATAGDLCVTMLMLPRRRVERVADARYVVLWGQVPGPVEREARARGMVFESYQGNTDFGLLRLP